MTNHHKSHRLKGDDWMEKTDDKKEKSKVKEEKLRNCPRFCRLGKIARICQENRF